MASFAATATIALDEPQLSALERELAPRCTMTAHCISDLERSIAIDWMMDVCQLFQLRRQTFHKAADILDRFLENNAKLSQRYLQLVAGTSLLLAAKAEEIYPPSIHDFVHATADTYTATQFRKMEPMIIQTMDWDLHSTRSVYHWVGALIQVSTENATSPTGVALCHAPVGILPRVSSLMAPSLAAADTLIMHPAGRWATTPGIAVAAVAVAIAVEYYQASRAHTKQRIEQVDLSHLSRDDIAQVTTLLDSGLEAARKRLCRVVNCNTATAQTEPLAGDQAGESSSTFSSPKLRRRAPSGDSHIGAVVDGVMASAAPLAEQMIECLRHGAPVVCIHKNLAELVVPVPHTDLWDLQPHDRAHLAAVQSMVACAE